MKVSNIYNDLNIKTRKPAFTGFVEDYSKIKNEFKEAVKTNAKKEVFDELIIKLKEIESAAKNEIVDTSVPKIFPFIVRRLGKIKIERTGNKTADTIAQLTKIALWGNFGKEVVGTGLYTVQALTNEDLPKDKRKFIGIFDLGVGVVSTTLSFVFGIGLRKKILSGYNDILEPLLKSPKLAVRSRSMVAVAGLAAFTSFALQVIIGKRIIAPAIAIPWAGRMKAKLQKKEALEKLAEQRKQEEERAKEQMNSVPPEVLAKTQSVGESSVFKQKVNVNV